MGGAFGWANFRLRTVLFPERAYRLEVVFPERAYSLQVVFPERAYRPQVELACRLFTRAYSPSRSVDAVLRWMWNEFTRRVL